MPANRYQSASELKKALQGWQGGIAGQTSKIAAGENKKPVSVVMDESEKTIQSEASIPAQEKDETAHWKPAKEEIFSI